MLLVITEPGAQLASASAEGSAHSAGCSGRCSWKLQEVKLAQSVISASHFPPGQTAGSGAGHWPPPGQITVPGSCPRAAAVGTTRVSGPGNHGQVYLVQLFAHLELRRDSHALRS